MNPILAALSAVGIRLPRRPVVPKACAITQADFVRLAKADAKRARKAAKRGAK